MSSTRLAAALVLLTMFGGSVASAQERWVGAYANIEDSYPDAQPHGSRPEPTEPPHDADASPDAHRAHKPSPSTRHGRRHVDGHRPAVPNR